MRTLTLAANQIGRGSLVLVNRAHPLRCGVAPARLVAVGADHPRLLLERRAARQLARALRAAEAGSRIVPVSGYRTHAEQQALYLDSVRENGAAFTRQFVAWPGCSEHQSGLAIDLAENAPAIDFIRPHFPYTGVCQTFREMAAGYGFIERYPAGGEALTQIAHEPWHFRYVGYPHAELMRAKGLTLEAYTDYVKEFPYDGAHLEFCSTNRRFEIYHVPVFPDRPAEITIPARARCEISGNNVDGMVVTLW